MPAAAQLLSAYVAALLQANRGVNLTGATEAEQARTILVEPSLAVRDAWPDRPPPRVAVDLGTGNGFPGVAVAVLWPSCRVVLVERRAKKARAVGDCLVAAGIANAEVLACDARELKNTAPGLLGTADLVTLRAVGPLGATTRLAAPLLAPGGRVVHWKRPGTDVAELAGGDEAAAALGLVRLADVAHDGGAGLLVVYARPGGTA